MSLKKKKDYDFKEKQEIEVTQKIEAELSTLSLSKKKEMLQEIKNFKEGRPNYRIKKKSLHLYIANLYSLTILIEKVRTVLNKVKTVFTNVHWSVNALIPN